MRQRIKCFILFMIFLSASCLASDRFIACPYIGQLHDVQETHATLADNALMKGIFFQDLNADNYQWNFFLYQSSNINYSSLWGGHVSGDLYFHPSVTGSFVAGLGTEYMQVNMDAGNNIAPMKNLTMKNNVLVPYGRFGYRFRFNPAVVSVSALPWAGVQFEDAWGSMSAVPPGPPRTVNSGIKQTGWYAMTGCNLHAMVFHMLEIELKYYAAYTRIEYQNNAAFMINYMFMRNLGVSYRYKYLETTGGSDRYNMFGVAVCF